MRKTAGRRACSGQTKHIEHCGDSYLYREYLIHYREYLIHENRPVAFHQFVEQANMVDLRYLDDCERKSTQGEHQHEPYPMFMQLCSGMVDALLKTGAEFEGNGRWAPFLHRAACEQQVNEFLENLRAEGVLIGQGALLSIRVPSTPGTPGRFSPALLWWPHIEQRLSGQLFTKLDTSWLHSEIACQVNCSRSWIPPGSTWMSLPTGW